MKRLNIRWRLTLWYGVVLAAVLFIFSAVVFWELRRGLLQRVDDGLHEELADVLFEVRRATAPEGLLEWLDRRFARHEGFDFQITNADGQRFFASQRMTTRSFPVAKAAPSTETFETIDSGGRFRVVEVQATGPQGPLSILLGRSLASFDHELSELLFVFSITGPMVLLVTFCGGYFLAGRALAPVQAITRTANQITAERLNQRIDIANPDDELGALSRTLNGMIERLEASFREMQRFTADAAHELRTPLTIVRNEIEVALRLRRSPEEYGRVLENVLEETIRLATLADELLFLSRHDAGLVPKATDRFALNDVLQEVVGQMQLLAQEKGVGLVLEHNMACDVAANVTDLRRVLYNLIDNAIKYTNAGGTVTIRSAAANGHVHLSIKDTGSGIPPEHLPHVFERFYRSDPARANNGSGAGLGLPICQAIVKSLRGTIQLESTLGRGTNVTIHLPCV